MWVDARGMDWGIFHGHNSSKYFCESVTHNHNELIAFSVKCIIPIL